jgi:hypothetical protein
MPAGFKARREVLPPGAVSPPVKAGSIVIFSEALTHGTLPWAAPFPRRTLLYKYAAKHVLFMQPASAPPGAELTEAQRKMLAPPSRLHPGWFPDEDS